MARFNPMAMPSNPPKTRRMKPMSVIVRDRSGMLAMDG